MAPLQQQEDEPQSILKNDISKSAAKRASKSVLFAVSDTPEFIATKKRKRLAQTPRQSTIEVDETEDYEDILPISKMDTRNVTLHRGRSSARKSASAAKVQVDLVEESPLTVPQIARTRRSKKLFD